MFWLIPLAIGAAALLSANSDSDDDESSSRDDSAEREAEAANRATEQKKQQLRQEITQFYNGELKKLATKVGNLGYSPSYSFVDIEAIKTIQSGAMLSKTAQAKLLAQSDVEKIQQQIQTLDQKLAELLAIEKSCLAAHHYLKTLQTGS